MSKLKAIVFDFDNTLVNTDGVRNLREAGDFDSIKEDAVGSTFPYKPVLRLLKKIRDSGVKTAIVTNSPRKYVQNLLDHHSMAELFDAVVTYDDVKIVGKKPNPSGILLALNIIGVDAGQDVIYVGDEYTDVIAAYRAGIVPIIPSWGSNKAVSTPPAAELSSRCIVEMVDDYEEMSLFAERCAKYTHTDFDRKSARFLPLDHMAHVCTIRNKLKIFCLGRYFSQKSKVTSEMHDNHALSIEIAKKDTDHNYQPPNWIAEMLLKVVKAASSYIFDGTDSIDVVSIVPRKEGKPERLELVLRRMQALSLQIGLKIKFSEDLFYFDRGAARSLRDRSAVQRQEEQQVHFHISNEAVAGLNVLVIDDVITTGSTMNRALQLLNQAGAKSAYGLGIAKTVSISEDVKICSDCGRDMIISKNKETGVRFWSCSGYFGNSCNYTESFNPVMCPKCKRELYLRKNRSGVLFYGCSGFNQSPQCKYTCSYRNEN